MAGPKPKSGAKYAFEHVSPKAQLVFYAGVFCVFAPFSLIYDLAAPKGLSWIILLLWSAYSGVTAVGWAYAFTRNVRFLWIIIPFSFLVGTLFGERFYPRSNVQVALFVEAGVCAAVIILGYICFIVFISGEGTKTVRLLTEIGLAKAIHSHLVPAVDQKTDHLELYGVSAQASEVGGDLMDVCHANGKTGLFIADITGHGVSAGVSISTITIPDSLASSAGAAAGGSAGAAGAAAVSRSTCFWVSSFPGSTTSSCCAHFSALGASPSVSEMSASALRAMTLSPSSSTTREKAAFAAALSPVAIWTRPSTTRAET